LEESYYIIQEYAGQYSQYKLKGDYRNFSFKKDSNVILKEASNIRFCKFAQLTRLVANVLKHTGGIIKTHGSGKMLIDEFKLKEEWDVVALRNFIQIGKTPLGNVFFIITRLYVFIIDLIAFIFNFKKFRVKSTEHHVIAEEIVNYDVRDSYKKYLKNVQQDGTVLFVDL